MGSMGWVGLCVGVMRVLRGCHLGVVWVLCGCHMGVVWVSYGSPPTHLK